MRTGSAVTTHQNKRPSTFSQGGYTLLVVVALVAVAAIGLYRAGHVLSTEQQREQEQMLLRIGTLYAEALQHYYESAPGSLKQYPAELEQLVMDTRYIGVARHLRQIYPDPFQPSKPWGIIRNASGRITGVYSTSELQPFLRSDEAPTANASHYSDWKFLAKEIR